MAQCRHDWILLLDDDECLNPAAVRYIDQELRDPQADIYVIPLRHYVLGVHDERAYYWPEAHPRLFRRQAVAFPAKVHAGIELKSSNVFRIPFETGACIHHLSHAGAHDWVEKTNRYTSRAERARDTDGDPDLLAYAHARLDHWAAQSTAPEDPYVAAVAALRAVYDIVDRVKAWEQGRGVDGAALFAQACNDLEAQYADQLQALARPHGGGLATPASIPSAPPTARASS